MPARNKVTMKVRELRLLKNMSQSELAQSAGLSNVTVSNLESGKLRRIELETIGKLCKALACTPGDLFQLPPLSDREIIKRQKDAIREVMGTLRYDKPFNPDELDSDLNQITSRSLDGALVVHEKSKSKPRKRR